MPEHIKAVYAYNRRRYEELLQKASTARKKKEGRRVGG